MSAGKPYPHILSPPGAIIYACTQPYLPYLVNRLVSAQSSEGVAQPSLREQSRLAIIVQPLGIVAALTIVGFALRRYHLGAESFWFDEADIVKQAQQQLSTLVQSFTAAGENGPLYVLLLHYWVAAINGHPNVARIMHIIFGQSYEAPIRGLSATFGAAAIPLMYILGRRVAGSTVGLVAALLLTFNPFHIWYSQDAKMYAMLVFMTLASTTLYIYAWERNALWLWAAYATATLAMLTTHSLAGVVLLAQIIAVPWLARGFRRQSEDTRGAKQETPMRLVRWGLATLLIFAPFLPILWLRSTALFTDTLNVGGWYSATTLTDILLTIFVKFAVNQAIPPWEAVGGVTMAALAIAGALWLLDFRVRIPRRSDPKESTILPGEAQHRSARRWDPRPNPESALVLFLYLVPVLAFWLLTLRLPLFQPRYLIMALPPYLILAAGGLLAAGRRHALLMVAPAGIFGLATAIALLSVNYSQQPQKEDWRGAMSYIADHARLRDTIIIFPGYLVTAAQTYYQPGGPGRVPDIPISTIPSLSTQGFGERELEAQLAGAVRCHERVWLVVSPPRQQQEDPQNKVQSWLQYNYHTFDTKQFLGVTLYGIAFNGIPDCSFYPGPDYPETYNFENGLQFRGYIYELRDNATTQPDASYFPLTLYWHNSKKLAADYMVRIRIRDKAGRVVVDDAAGMYNGYWPTSEWPTDTYTIDYRDLRLPGGLTPGSYTVSIELYPKGHPDQPLKLQNGGTEITLQTPLQVVPWKPQ